jgi:predicted Zn-dependent protease
VRFNLGLAHVQAKRWQDAISALEPLVRKPVPEVDALTLLASAYESNQQTPQALDLLRRAIELYPRDEQLYINLADVCLEHQGIQLGVEVLEAGAKNIPDSARIHTMLGVLHSRAAMPDKAEDAFKKAEELAPNEGFGRLGLAVALMQLNAPEEAVRVLREQAARTPDSLRISLTLAQALIQKGPTEEEMREVEQRLAEVTARDANNAKAFSLLGKLYFQQEHPEKALPALEAAVRLDPADRTAAYQLMILYRRAGRTQEAAVLQEKVRELLEAERNQEAETGQYRLVRAPEPGANR